MGDGFWDGDVEALKSQSMTPDPRKNTPWSVVHQPKALRKQVEKHVLEVR